MPHIVLEYSKNLSEKVDVSELLTEIHGSLVSEGIDKARLKTRAIAVEHSVVGDANVDQGYMAHIELRLLEGRSKKVKNQYFGIILKSTNENWKPFEVKFTINENGKGDYFTRPVLVLHKFNKNLFWGIPLTTKIKNNPFFRIKVGKNTITLFNIRKDL